MAEGKLFVITGFQGGVSVGVQADDSNEFVALVQSIATNPVLKQIFDSALPGLVAAAQAGQSAYSPAEQQAVANLQAAGLVSTVGQPLPQPTVVQQPAVVVQQPALAAAPATPTPPPGATYPGDCAHGVRQYNDKPARGKAWLRWECALPFIAGNKAHNDSRCKPVNV